MQRAARGSGVLSWKDRSSAIQGRQKAAERVARTQRGLDASLCAKEYVLPGLQAICLELQRLQRGTADHF